MSIKQALLRLWAFGVLYSYCYRVRLYSVSLKGVGTYSFVRFIPLFFTIYFLIIYLSILENQSAEPRCRSSDAHADILREAADLAFPLLNAWVLFLHRHH